MRKKRHPRFVNHDGSLGESHLVDDEWDRDEMTLASKGGGIVDEEKEGFDDLPDLLDLFE